ncbi:SDR family NAD(P)-dependent oxidoreductase [Leptospira licerasiae]|uniref:SDR family NAD(P)-dependent oxidoreductase n=1 Tax=Leptospira licerasiae TaxID=447106 RepID=UPI00108343D1|nr:glucose 1-dehydrogenase [Leptospira licerasiae]TGM86733.1 glucose 1-dehydrogenase [Leptospira licerasiae]
MSKLKGKVAVVTGASKGIGASIAKTFGSAGASVVVNYSSSKEGADKVVAEIEKQGGKAIAVQGDMSKSSDVKRLFSETKKAFGSVNILVNNAGVFEFAPLEAVTEDEFHRQMNTNVLGPILATQESLNHFAPEGGSVINISSIVSDIPVPNSVVYASTKGALDTVSQVLALELSSKKIRVNTIAPGGVETEGAHRLGMIGSDMEKMIISKTPLGRLGQPEDIAKVALFLASEDSYWLTGERISASGGFR